MEKVKESNRALQGGQRYAERAVPTALGNALPASCSSLRQLRPVARLLQQWRRRRRGGDACSPTLLLDRETGSVSRNQAMETELRRAPPHFFSALSAAKGPTDRK
jgi:hypothetical protein